MKYLSLFPVFLLCFFVFSPVSVYAENYEAGGSLSVPAEYGSVSAILQKVKSLKEEQKEIENKIEENRTALEAKKKEWAGIEKDVMEKSENVVEGGAFIDGKRPEIEALCTGTFEEGDPAYDSAKAACDVALEPFNDKVKEVNADKEWLEKHALPIDQEIEHLSENDGVLRMQKVQIFKKIADLKKMIPHVALRECNTNCNNTGMSDDAAHQCLQHCMDGARSEKNLPPVEEVPASGDANVVFPDWSSVKPRTAEDVIREDKERQKTRPKKGVHYKDVPPPKL